MKERDAGQETTECLNGRKARKKSRRQRSRGDTAIRTPTWQDVTCGEQEEETGQI